MTTFLGFIGDDLYIAVENGGQFEIKKDVGFGFIRTTTERFCSVGEAAHFMVVNFVPPFERADMPLGVRLAAMQYELSQPRVLALNEVN